MTKSKLQITEFNCESGEQIVRDATTEEIAQMEIDSANAKAIKAESDAKAAQRQVILDRLGLTTEEAAILLS